MTKKRRDYTPHLVGAKIKIMLPGQSSAAAALRRFAAEVRAYRRSASTKSPKCPAPQADRRRSLALQYILHYKMPLYRQSESARLHLKEAHLHLKEKPRLMKGWGLVGEGGCIHRSFGVLFLR